MIFSSVQNVFSSGFEKLTKRPRVRYLTFTHYTCAMLFEELLILRALLLHIRSMNLVLWNGRMHLRMRKRSTIIWCVLRATFIFCSTDKKLFLNSHTSFINYNCSVRKTRKNCQTKLVAIINIAFFNGKSVCNLHFPALRTNNIPSLTRKIIYSKANINMLLYNYIF